MQAQRFTSLAAGAALIASVGCSSAPGDTAVQSSFHSYTASPGSLLDSTLVVDEVHSATHLSGVTHLADGACLSEQAVLDTRGRLVSASYTVSYGAGPTTGASLDARSGTVEVWGARGLRRVQLHNDRPWVWAPVIEAGQAVHTVSTPLSAVVTMRAAHAAHAVRSIDLASLEEHGTASDQLLVSDQAEAELVVVGDDVITLRGGVPRFWHVWAFNQDVRTAQPENLLDTPSALACSPMRATARPN